MTRAVVPSSTAVRSKTIIEVESINPIPTARGSVSVARFAGFCFSYLIGCVQSSSKQLYFLKEYLVRRFSLATFVAEQS
jgi:hypothetical protein